MAFLELSDFNGSIEAVAFPKTWQQIASEIRVDSIYGITGRLKKDGKLSLSLKELFILLTWNLKQLKRLT